MAFLVNDNFYLVWLNWPYGAFRINEKGVESLSRCIADAGAKGEIRVARSEAEFLNFLPEATHAIVWNFSKEWFAIARRLRVLATPGAGRELVPSCDEMPAGIVKVHGAFHGAIMSETVIACVFAEARGLFAAERFQREGELWARDAMSPFCSMVAGTHAVILGNGRIGGECGRKLEALGVRVTGIGRRNFNLLDGALVSADWLIMALPSDTGTDDLLNAARIALLPQRSVVINIGRGNSVDETALAEALRSRRIRAAYLDVFKREPLDSSSPLAGDIPNLHRLPHCSAFAPEYFPLFFEELAKNGHLK